MQYSFDVILLWLEDHNELEDQHEASHCTALNINPEDLSSVPRIKQVVTTCNYCDQVHEADLEQFVAIDAFKLLIIF